MELRDQIDSILVQLQVSGRQALFLMLASDGGITRSGTGSPHDRAGDLVAGVTRPTAFRRLVRRYSDDLLRWCGITRTDPRRRGEECELKVGLRRCDGETLWSVWQYGSESLGPPPEVGDFVRAAVSSTEGWFREQQRAAALAREDRPRQWWRFWA
jgi:hypothetical protein